MRREHSKIVSPQLHSWSAAKKAALLQTSCMKIILTSFPITETWLPSDAPQAIKAYLAPPGYNLIHKCRALSTEGKGGGLASCSVVAKEIFDKFQPSLVVSSSLSRSRRCYHSLKKKRDPGPLNPANHRSRKNLTIFSKIIERLALRCIRSHLLSNNNYSSYQSLWPF